MTIENISIKFTRPIHTESIVQMATEVDSPSSERSPQIVNGRLTKFTEEQIIQLKLEPHPIEVVFRGKKYKLDSLNQAGEFKLAATYEHITVRSVIRRERFN